MESIESKLKKLEAMMVDTAASDGEKSNAFQLFEKLVKNYNIDLTKRKDSSDISEHKSQLAFTESAFHTEYNTIIALYAMYFNVLVICTKTKDEQKLYYYKYVGKDDDIVMCDYMFTTTIRQFQKLFKMQIFNSNASGIIGEFNIELKRIIEQKMSTLNQYLSTGNVGTGLILIRKNELDKFKQFYTEKYGQFGYAAHTLIGGNGKGVGASMAKNINFNRPIESGGSIKQLK